MKRALVLLLVSGTAYAGGTVRPNGSISARGIGMGGAWAAWADDPTAIYFNPGALDAIEPQVLLGGELVLGPRRYTPVAADGTRGDPQKTVILAPVPVFGIVGRFNDDDEPSRFTLGLGAWNTFGGRAYYEKTGMPALDSTQDICFEVNAAAAYHVSDRLSVGAVARLGIGLFSIESTMNPYDATMSASGVGGALGVGALLRPTDNIRVGVNWRSPMRITTKGTGAIMILPGTTNRPQIEHDQNWPQQVQLGVGIAMSPRFKLATQVDWSQWSQVATIQVRFPNGELPDQIYPEYWKDNWSLRFGGEFAVSHAFQLRAGTYYDTPAVPDHSLERQYSDAHKFGVALGAGVRAGLWRIDFSADGIIPRLRTVPDNRQDVTGVGALVNKAPGEYLGSLITFELAAARQF